MSANHERNSRSSARDHLRGGLLTRRHRFTVAAVLLGALFVGLFLIGALLPPGTQELLTTSDPIESLNQALLTSTLTGVTLVLTISQLVLSQEFGAVGDQRQRLDGALEFRRDVEALTDATVAPAEPAAFFECLLESISGQASAVADAIEHGTDETASDGGLAFMRDLSTHADEVAEEFEGAEFGRFEVVWAALAFDYSQITYEARRVVEAHREAFDDDQVDNADTLLEQLEAFGVTREHFKTLYFQWELTGLSLGIMVSAIPAILASAGMLTYFDPAYFTGRVFGVVTAHIVVTAAATVALAPFALLVSYMARILYVTRRTLSAGPFLLRSTQS